jgi:hypothetical protein
MGRCWEDAKNEKAVREIGMGMENGEQVMMIIKEKLEDENTERKGKMILTGVEEYGEEENEE